MHGGIIMVTPKLIGRRKSIHRSHATGVLIGLITLLLSSCFAPRDYLGGGQLVDSPDGARYGSAPGQSLYPQNQTDPWQNANSGLNQPAGLNQATDINVPGRYDYQENPPLNTGQQTGGFTSSGDNRYLDANTRQAINNMRNAQRQAAEIPPYQNIDPQNAPPAQAHQNLQGAMASGYSSTSENPLVTNVGVSEIGIPANAANPSQIDRISNPALAVNSARPTMLVPVPQGIDANYLTRPAVGTSASNYESSESIIQKKERWFAEHPDDVNTALSLYYHYLAEGDLQKARSFLPQNFNQADLAQQAIKELNQQISERNLLKINHLKICERVEGFGRYSELPQAELNSGKSRWIDVYFELENYAGRLNADGMYSSEIYAEITLYDGGYRPIIAPLSEDVPDKSTYSPRKDFFLVGTIQLPALNPGTYIIAVQVEDKIANKRSRREEFVFQVGANLTTVNYGLPSIR